MKRTELPDRLQEMLQRISYVTVATVCSDGQPWNSPVVGKFDDDMNLYWVSWSKNQHSRNVAHEPRIFVVVYDSQVPEGQGEGLYLQMHARALDTPDQLSDAKEVYATDFFTHDFRHSQFEKGCPQRIYKAVPEKIWYNVDGEAQGHFVDKRKLVTTRSK